DDGQHWCDRYGGETELGVERHAAGCVEQRPEPARGGHGGDVEGEPTADEYGHVAGEVSVHQPKGSGDGRAGRKAFQDQHDGGDGPRPGPPPAEATATPAARAAGDRPPAT